jgi:uncharacterized protein with ParB-like and HNH nuclease domain
MISPERQTIEQIMGSSKIVYSVPNYQRTFDWGKNELLELVTDLLEVKNKELFLGNFIFDISDTSNFKIVDGQQRLTSISIIFIALREQAKKLNENEMQSEIQRFISAYSKIRNKNEVKISVSDNIKTIFEHMAHPEWDGIFPDSLNERSIKRQVNKVKPIYKYIEESISKFNSDQLSTFVKALWDTYVIVIKVEGNEDVFSVFERTNARGLDLNIGDLLKNYIFSHEDDKLEQKWSQIVDNANGGLPRLLKYFWVSRKGYIQQSKLYKSLKDYVKEIDSPTKNGINQFIDELYMFSRFYHSVQSLDPLIVKDWFEEYDMEEISSNEDYYPRINRVFQALKFFRVTQAYPLIFSILHAYKNSNIKISRLFKILEVIEKYHFVNNIISGRIGNEVEKLYAEKAAAIFATDDLGKELTELTLELSKKRALEQEFTANFIDNVTYCQKNIPLLNYVFDRINNYDSKKKSPVKGSQYVSIFSPEKNLSKRNYNIEHFFAQDQKKNYKADELDTFDAIGNLLLISRHSNSEFGNKSSKEKVELIKNDKKHYGNLRYLDDFLDTYKDQVVDWGLKDIDDRSTEFSKSAYKETWSF